MPDACRTEIEFVRGGRSEWLLPLEADALRLPSRFAVVQDTYRPDKVDAFIDKPLWFALLQFAREFERDGVVSIARTPSERPATEDDEKSVEQSLAEDAALSDEDWLPPNRVFVRRRGVLILAIATEYWIFSGGPDLYHDSLTYSIYSSDDLQDRVVQFLAIANAASQWALASVVVPAPDPPPPTVFDKVVAWIRRYA